MTEHESNEQTELCGSVDNITFRREDTGFSVIELACEEELVTVVGVFPSVTVGEGLRVFGRWDFHASFGRQFRAENFVRSLPATQQDMLKYLSSGAIKGIGPATARKIVEIFGENAFDVLQNSPGRLSEIKGISPAKAMKISQDFREQFAAREVMLALERYGMTPSECLRVFKALGKASVESIKLNPYILCSESIGIGFERADAVASRITEPFERSLRVMAGIVHVVRHNLGNGHTCVPRDSLSAPASKLLGVDADIVDTAVSSLASQKRLILRKLGEREFVFLPEMYRAEATIAEKISLLLRFPPAGGTTLEKDIDDIEREENIKYENKQRYAIETAVKKGLLILTGGPGTGKTTALNGILRLFERDGLDVALAAPTGRAAKRMSEVTGREAKTLHRLLEAEWDENDRSVFGRDEQNPLSAHAVIVDELSMVDTVLFAALLRALPLGCRLIMVGDSDQLPAVGAGNVLRDLIDSGLIPVVALTEVFRQASRSLIVTNAHKIVRGEMPVLGDRSSDFFFLPRRNAYDTAQTVVQLCAQRLPKAYSYSPLADIQVLCPSRMGETGTLNLNRLLQAELNPPDKDKKEVNLRGFVFRLGDKIIQTRNDYNIEWTKSGEAGTGVFNGDIGIMSKILPDQNIITVDFDDGRRADFSLEAAAEELAPAYAMTVHKSQGNEFEAVVMPLSGTVRRLAYRNLLYTAVTRAKKLLIIIGDEAEIQHMVSNNRMTLRYSALKYFLTEG